MAIFTIGTAISAVLKIFDAIKVPVMLWFANRAGKKQGYKDAKADANVHFIKVTDKVAHDRDAAAARRLRNDDTDDDAQFRD